MGEKEKATQAWVFIFFAFALMVLAFAIALNFNSIVAPLANPVNLFFLALLVAFAYVWSSGRFWLILKDYERAVIFRFGVFMSIAGPGWVFLIPGIDSHVQVDLRTKTIDMPKQDIITKDRVEAQVDAVLYLTIKDPKAAILNVEDYEEAVKQFITSALRDKAGTLDIDHVIAERERLAKELNETLKEAAREWGVKAQVELKDVDLPKTIVEAMHEERAAHRKKAAMITVAEGKKIEIERIKEATKNMTNENIVYYYLQALEKLAEGRASKLIVPMELTKISSFFEGKIKPESSEGVKVEQLIEKYAHLIKGAAKGDAPKEVQKVIVEETPPEVLEKKAQEKADKLFETEYNLIKKAKKKANK